MRCRRKRGEERDGTEVYEYNREKHDRGEEERGEEKEKIRRREKYVNIM